MQRVDAKKQSAINEEKVAFGTTFLSDYWKEEIRLPQESRISGFVSIIRRTFSVLKAEPLSTLSSYIIVSSSLLMLTMFLLFDFNIGRLVNQVGSSHEGILYFSNSVTQEEITTIQDMLRDNTTLESVRFISKEEALTLFEEDLGADASLLKGLEENPLPDAIEFMFKPDSEPQIEFEKVKSDLKEFTFIEEVSLGAPWADAAEKFRSGLQKMSLTVFVIVLAVVMFIVANAVKLMLMSQKEEIEIMQLVGASRSQIMKPYLITGFLQGFLGALTALFLCYMLFQSFILPLNSFLVIGVSYDFFTFLSPYYQFILVLTGILLGLGGSYLALIKWTK